MMNFELIKVESPQNCPNRIYSIGRDRYVCTYIPKLNPFWDLCECEYVFANGCPRGK